MSDTVKIAAETSAQVATNINGVEYRAKGGYFEMPTEHARAHRTFGNLPTPSALLPVGRSAGYRCTNQACRFASFFVTCSHCNGHCERE
jgi:hypothetical protein